MPRAAPEVVIVGGGVVGCAIAFRLARDGCRVVLVERDAPGGGASGAAAGMIAPQAEAGAGSPLLDLGLRSRDIYPDWVEEIRALSGRDPGYRAAGLVVAALTEAEAEELAERRRWQSARGLRAEPVDRTAIVARFGEVGEEIREGMHLPDEAVVNPRRLVAGLAAGAERAGAEIRTGQGVRDIVVRSGCVRGVRIGEDRLAADLVILAAGCWTPRLARQVPDLPPVEPVRGQLVELVAGKAAPGCVLYTSAGYVVPRGEHVVVGSTSERAGFDDRPTAAGVEQLLSVASRLLPRLATAPFVSAWAGLRPDSPDGLPTIGFSEVPGLLIATGHYRNGILLAPVTAELVADLVAGREPRQAPGPFRPARHCHPAPRPGR